MMISKQFGRFCAVGTAGFLLDAALLQGLISIVGMGPYSARVVSFLAAATLTWVLNRNYTFRGRVQKNTSVHGEWLRYTGLMLFGAVVNYAAYVYCLMTWVLAAQFPVLGVVAGSAAGLALNFASSRLLFSRTSTIKSVE